MPTKILAIDDSKTMRLAIKITDKAATKTITRDVKFTVKG